ncbi:MAG: sulfur modification protein DndB [Acidobacteriota bacterium]|nr:sulfur modification protein DndB [Acidobacteriota bacterium]
MIENLFRAEELKALARRKSRDQEFRTVRNNDLSEYLAQDWSIQRKNKATTRLLRPKPLEILLRDRVWSLLYAMGFTHLSGEGDAILQARTKSEGEALPLGVVGLDHDIAIAVKCRSASSPRRDPKFAEHLADHSLTRERFANAANMQYPLNHKRVPVLAVFTSNLILSEQDIDKATEQKISLFNENDLAYYEQLSSHLGPAAKYQFFADMLPGKRIHGLQLAVPAIEAKMGKHTYFSFSITPEALLKIAYVSHRAKGKATDVNTYQRMIKKSRLRKIREYINQNGVFPTNIVLSLEGRKNLRFERAGQQGGPEGARYGILHLSPAYRSAWIIDGQHRLFAYSGLQRAKTSYLSVLAFQNLPASQQAQLFIDINHEQKSVKRSLLQELYAELNWDADDEEKRIGAIVSKAIQALNEEKDSPLYGRILLTDDSPTDQRCISLASIFSALNQPEMFIVKKSEQYGPLWADDNERTLKRTLRVTKAWFGWIRAESAGWWDLGKAEGGGLAMNDGVAVCLGVLRVIFHHLNSRGTDPSGLADNELLVALEPFGVALGQYFGSLAAEKRQVFRSLRGNQGKARARRGCEQALHEAFPDFLPPGLEEFLKLEAAQTNERGYGIIHRIETALQRLVIDTLKAEYEDKDEAWWYSGIPEPIRKKASERREEARGKGNKEGYLDLIDFRSIATKNWELFEDVLPHGEGRSKDQRTEWIMRVNELRKVVMHPAKQQVLSWDDLAELERYDGWLQKRDDDIEGETDGE